MTQVPVILVTGAGKGIGRAIAQEIARRREPARFEPRLFLTARTETDLQTAEAECRAAGLPVVSCAADLSTAVAVDRVYSACLKAFGQVDCLVNNAGVGRFGSFGDLTEADLDFVLATNLKGLFLLTQKAFRDMEKRRSGHLIFITSVAAETPFEQSAIYCMSKFAQKGLVEVLRLYGRKCNVRVTNVMPGAVFTPMWGTLEPAIIEKMMKPESIARVVVDSFLADPRACVEEVVIRPTAGDL